jgi:outer membrane protein TolC
MKSVFLLLALSAPAAARAETVLSPQFVIERITGESREARRIELQNQAAYTDLYNILGRYDIGLNSKLSYENSRIRYLSGGGNIRDQNTIFSIGAAKRTITGTTIGLTFNQTHQDSILRTNQNFGGRTPNIFYDVAELSVSQDLIGNFLGASEQKEQRAAELGVEAADLNAAEGRENLVLETLRLYWNAYVAKLSLREAEFQKDKYAELVKEIEQKARLSFVMPGDLPKARAEYGAQVRNIKSATYEYVRNVEQLLAALRMQAADRNIRFDVKDELPEAPTMVMPVVDGMRPVRAAAKDFEGADLLQKSIAAQNTLPQLKLTGVAGLTGLQPQGSDAFSELTSRNYPRYAVALELNYKLFSDAYRGNLNQARVNADLSYNTLEKQKEDLRQAISTAMEQVRFTYAAAVSAIDEQNQWDQAVKAQERTFRQGRVDFSQLIIDYNSYYRARAQRIRSLGDYQIALLNYQAAVDELLK